MARDQSLTIKDHLRETLLFQRRILVSAILGCILLAGLIGRLFWLQVISHDHYTALSEDNRVSIVPIAPTRGLIYDRNGVLLAQNVPSRTLELVPEHIPDLNATLKQLQSLINITDDEISRFNDLRKKKRRFEGIPLRFRLSDSEAARIAVHLDQLPGVEITAELMRHYPQGKLASHAIGYVARINEEELSSLDASRYAATKYIGKVGVERSYEDELHGEVGYQRVETNAAGRIVDVLERTLPIPGKNLYLTLDARVQMVAEQAFGDNNGALVAINPDNGEVIAFVSMPTYDPNLFVTGIDTKTYDALNKSSDRPLFNRALQGQYPPGSTIKPFIGLAGLENKVISPDSSLYCPGYYQLKGDDHKYRDWKKGGHGETNLTKAIVESCDVYFYDLAQTLKIDRIEDFLGRFGVGHPTGIDIRGEENGLLPGKDWKRRTHHLPWFPGETLITGIGQGFTLVTPLQLAEMTAELGTRGIRYRPHIVRGIVEPGDDKLVVHEAAPQRVTKMDDPQNWQTVINAMTQVVSGIHGTARSISRDLKYKIAGKTGTAQVYGIKQDEEGEDDLTKIPKKLRDHALFIAFAPADAPKIAVAVVVEHGGHGGSIAAPIARKVMDAYLLGDK
ncbi:MAG: penicillin-binding protein 2 [Gammaproteobacteria bacterium]|nr:penicillin-binding protein 2 [Gammaproteobacteria bacterium]